MLHPQLVARARYLQLAGSEILQTLFTHVAPATHAGPIVGLHAAPAAAAAWQLPVIPIPSAAHVPFDAQTVTLPVAMS